jgi:hypothetical protein
MKKIILFFLIVLNQQLYAQHKTDVLVLGGSASGTAAALQAARSGVKSILVEANSFLIGPIAPDMSIPAFDFGIWKEWRDSCKKDVDSMQLDPRVTLEKIIGKEKKLQYFKETQVVKITEKKNSWEVTIRRNGKLEEIKTKVLVDAVFEINNSAVLNAKIVALKEGHIEGLVTYGPSYKEQAYDQTLKLYRTSAAAAYGRDSSVHFFPIGAFIAKEKENLLFATHQASFKGFKEDEFKNLALWVNVGQMIGAAAAFGPFFNVAASKADVRVTQSEVMNFKGLIYPVKDVATTDKAWGVIQRIICTQLLKFDFVTGKFNPNAEVLAEDIRGILSELHPRSRIWFIENKADRLTIKQVISLVSFIGGREEFDLDRELSSSWKSGYELQSEYQESKVVTKKELAIIFDNYLSPFNIKVNMTGYFLR